MNADRLIVPEEAAIPIVIRSQSDEMLMRLNPDGSFEFPTGDPEGAAAIFCDHVRELWRSALPPAELRLADALAVANRERDDLALRLETALAAGLQDRQPK